MLVFVVVRSCLCSDHTRFCWQAMFLSRCQGPPAQVTFQNSHNLSLSTVQLPRGDSGVITATTSSEQASGLKCGEMNSIPRTWSHRHLLQDPCLDRTADEHVWSPPISSLSLPSTTPPITPPRHNHHHHHPATRGPLLRPQEKTHKSSFTELTFVQVAPSITLRSPPPHLQTPCYTKGGVEGESWMS